MERVPPQRRVWRGPLTVKTELIHWEGVVSLIRQGPLGPATFPVGEGCLPAGEHSSGPILHF